MVRSAAMTDVGQSLELTDENVELVLDEIRPYLMAGATPPPYQKASKGMLVGVIQQAF